MPRRLYNWTYRDVTGFLQEHGFVYSEPLEGSHQAWIKFQEDGELERIVEVNFTHGSYKPKTLRIMIRQSGIDQEEWIKSASS